MTPPGVSVARPEPELLAEAIVECARRGPELRRTTLEWYAANEKRLSLESSLSIVAREYSAGAPAPQRRPMERLA